MLEAGKIFGVFDDQVWIVMTGREWGNCRLGDKIDLAAAGLIDKLGDRLGAEVILVPNTGFSTKLAAAEQDSSGFWFEWNNRLKRSIPVIDGVIIKCSRQAVAINNADCPVGIVYDPASRRLAVLHLGLKCLLGTGDSTEANLIAAAVRELRSPPENLRFFIGCGIGPCCYGFRRGNKLLMAFWQALGLPSNIHHPIVTKGPRRGQEAVDLAALAIYLANRAGIKKVTISPFCTSCHGLDSDGQCGPGTFFSHVRQSGDWPNDQPKTVLDRNCVMVMLR